MNWSCAPPSSLDCLKVSSNKAVRTILSENKREHVLPLFKELDILPLDELLHVENKKQPDAYYFDFMVPD